MDRSVEPAPGEITSIKMLGPERLVLDNDINLFSMDGCSENVIQTEIIFPVGTKHQAMPLQANLAAEMLLEGSAGLPGGVIMEKLDAFGAFVEISVSYDRTSLSIYCTNRYVSEVFSVIYDITENPNFKQKDFDLLLNNKKQAFMLQKQKVSFLSKRGFYKELFRGHPYGNLAEYEDYEKISMEDCRSFYKDRLKPAAFEVFVAGRVDENITNKLKEAFSAYQNKQIKNIQRTPVLNRQNKKQHIHIDHTGVQTSYRKGKLTIDRSHEDYIGLRILMTVLGGYFGSRLMKNIREDKGYTYGIGAGLISFDAGTVMFIATETGNQYVEAVEKEIVSEIARLVRDRIPDEELRLVKNYMFGSLARSFDGAFAMMDRFKSVHFSNLGLDFYQKFIEELRTMDAKRLQKIADRYLEEDQFLTVTAGEGNYSL